MSLHGESEIELDNLFGAEKEKPSVTSSSPPPYDSSHLYSPVAREPGVLRTIRPEHSPEEPAVLVSLTVDEQGENHVSGHHQGSQCKMEKGPLIVIGVIVGIIAALILILVPLSYAPLEYYEYGFRRRSTTGSVDTSKVYGSGGRHLVGPDYEMKVFPADAHFEVFESIDIFTSDRLQVTLSCTAQYFLRKDQLHLLHANYDIHYQPVLRNNAVDALKGAATQYSVREFIHDRELVEATLFGAVRERLGGVCCEKNCGQSVAGVHLIAWTGERGCIPGCKAYSTCTDNDMGLFAEVRYFQLLDISIPGELNERFLEALVLQEETETELLLQEASLIRKETDKMVAQINNEANEISNNATATANLIGSRAESSAQATIEKARSDGLQYLYQEIGVSNPEQRASFDYLRTLRSQSHVKLNVDFQQLITGGIN